MDEREIVAGCLRGGPESYRRLVDAFGPLVMAVALNILGNKEDAEDVSQEVFLQVFRRLDCYDPARSFKTWLLTIAYRRAIDVIKKKRRFKEFAARAAFDPATAPALRAANPGKPEKLPSPLLKKLSPRERTALCLWANEEYTAAEISQVLGCSAATARVTLFNARRKVKSLLETSHDVLQNG